MRKDSQMDSSQVVVVAIFRARAGREQALSTALQAMLAPTRLESGCLNYDLHRSNDDLGLFFFHETWVSADDHRVHLDTEHVRHLLEITPKLLLEPIRELKGTLIEE